MSKRPRRIPVGDLGADRQLAAAIEKNFIEFAGQLELLSLQMQQALTLAPGGEGPGIPGLGAETPLQAFVEHFDDDRGDGALVPYGKFASAIAAESARTNAISNGDFSNGFTSWNTGGASVANALTAAPVYDTHAEIQGNITQSFTFTGIASVGLYVHVGAGATFKVYLGGVEKANPQHTGDWQYIAIDNESVNGTTELKLESVGANSLVTAVMVESGSAFARSFVATSGSESDILLPSGLLDLNGFTMSFRFNPYGQSSGTLVEIKETTDTILLAYDATGLTLSIGAAQVKLSVAVIVRSWNFIAFSVRKDGYALLALGPNTVSGTLKDISGYTLAANWNLGRKAGGTPNHAEGLFDELRIERRVVTPALLHIWSRMNQPFVEQTWRASAGVNDHGKLAGLLDYDHTNLVHRSVASTIQAVHTFNPTAAGAPFALGANATGQQVAGLNADQVDGQHEAAFPRLGGRAGGQKLTGGTAAGEKLQLESTSHATKGSVESLDPLLLPGQLNWLGLTTTTADPTTTEYPADKDIGIHINTTSGNVFLTYNDAGTIKKTQLV